MAKFRRPALQITEDMSLPLENDIQEEYAVQQEDYMDYADEYIDDYAEDYTIPAEYTEDDEENHSELHTTEEQKSTSEPPIKSSHLETVEEPVAQATTLVQETKQEEKMEELSLIQKLRKINESYDTLLKKIEDKMLEEALSKNKHELKVKTKASQKEFLIGHYTNLGFSISEDADTLTISW